jgi:hypothetical protein
MLLCVPSETRVITQKSIRSRCCCVVFLTNKHIDYSVPLYRIPLLCERQTTEKKTKTMGSCQSVAQQTAKDREITREINEQRKKLSEEVKFVLLGKSFFSLRHLFFF